MTPARAQPRRGEVWDVDFAPTRGHEQTGLRPALVISSDEYNKSPAGLVVVLPITKSIRNIPWHLRIAKGRSGLSHDSAMLCDHIRSANVDRLAKQRGDIESPVLEEAQQRLKYLLDIP